MASPCRSRISSSGTSSGDRTRPSRTLRRAGRGRSTRRSSGCKQVASHFGGTAQGVCMSWPGHIKDVGGIRTQFHHVIDIVPTILEATGISAPDTINGIKQRPIEGVSMVYTWDKANANAPTRHTTQYFEMLGNRAIYHDGWVAATTPVTIPWELSTKHAAGRDHRLQVGTLQHQRGFHRGQRSRRQDAGQAQGNAGRLLRRGEEVRRAAARQLDARALPHAASERDGGTERTSPIPAS